MASIQTLVTLAEHLEEQLGASLGQGHEAQFVDDQKLESAIYLQATAFLAHALATDPWPRSAREPQSSGGGEAHGQSPLTRSQTETEGVNPFMN